MRLARPGFAARSVLRLPIRRALHRLGDPPSGKPVFYDMAHSNNAARIRLWRLLKEGMTEELDRCVVAYPDLKTPAFKVLNPLQKVPALVHADKIFQVHLFRPPKIMAGGKDALEKF